MAPTRKLASRNPAPTTNSSAWRGKELSTGTSAPSSFMPPPTMAATMQTTPATNRLSDTPAHLGPDPDPAMATQVQGLVQGRADIGGWSDAPPGAPRDRCFCPGIRRQIGSRPCGGRSAVSPEAARDWSRLEIVPMRTVNCFLQWPHFFRPNRTRLAGFGLMALMRSAAPQ